MQKFNVGDRVKVLEGGELTDDEKDELRFSDQFVFGNREVNFDLDLVRGFIKGRRISD